MVTVKTKSSKSENSDYYMASDYQSSSIEKTSEEDDKEHPAYWQKSREFYSLPTNVRNAVTHAKLSSKHSDFYHKLKDLTYKI